MKTGRHKGLFIGLLLTLVLAYLSMSLSLMSGPYIVSELGGSLQIAIYAFSVFGIGNGVGIPLGRLLIGKMHAWRLISPALFLFAIVSFISASTSGYPTFLISRFLEGVISGTFFQIILQIQNNFFQKEQVAIFSSVSANFFITGAVAGVCIGGWASYVYEWRDVVYLQGAFCLLLSLFLFFQFQTLTGLEDKPIEPPVSLLSFSFYSIGVICIGFVLVTGQQFDWFRSPLMNILLTIGSVCFLFFILHNLYHETPLFPFRFLKNVLFSLCLFSTFMFFGIYFAVVTLLSLWLTIYANYTPIWLSVIFGAMLVSAFLYILLEKRFPKVDPRFYLLLSFFFFGFSCFYTTIFNVEINLERLAISRLFAGFGLTLFLAPALKLCDYTHKDCDRDTALMFHTARVLGAGIGSGFYQILWQRREVFFHSRMGELLTNFSSLTEQFLQKAQAFHLQGLQSPAQMDVFLETYAFALALDDIFYLLGWIITGLFVLLLLSFIVKPTKQLIPRERSEETCQKVELS